MSLAVLSTSMALVCMLASVKRLRVAVSPTHLHPEEVLRALRGDAGRRRAVEVSRMLASAPPSSWERELAEALDLPEPARTAYVNEQLTEFDHRARAWARVPRVCASIASSTSFLLACVAMRRGLAAAGDLAPEDAKEAFEVAVQGALGVAAVGIAAAIFCAAIQRQARKASQAHLSAADELVARLMEVLPPHAQSPAQSPGK